MPRLEAVLSQALQDAAVQRSQYARDVLTGHQRWSGADLKGKARRFGASYAERRTAARAALHRAGGLLINIERGLTVAASRLTVDDFGNEVFETLHGLAVPATRDRFISI